MVFQNYALYPHMTVAQNLAFGLKLRKTDRAEIRRRVQTAAATLGLEDYLERKPSALSGGQRQRVAMGRAIVREPRAYLMDEPLSKPRRPVARADAGRDPEAPARARRHHDLRHPRPDRGDDDGRTASRSCGAARCSRSTRRSGSTGGPRTASYAGFIGSPAMKHGERALEAAPATIWSCRSASTPLVVDEGVLAERPGLAAFEAADVVIGIRPEDIEDAAFVGGAPPGRTLTTVCSLREALGSEVLVHFPVATHRQAGTEPPLRWRRRARPSSHVCIPRRPHVRERSWSSSSTRGGSTSSSRRAASPCTTRQLGGEDAHRCPAHERARRGVVGTDVGVQLLDARRACVVGETRHQDGADAATLPLVGHLDGDLCLGAVAHEARDPDRLAVDQRNEHMMVAVHAREMLEIAGS